MRNRISFLFCFVAVVILLFHSCVRVVIFDDSPGESLVPVEFTPQIGGVTTRVNGTTWEADDHLGIFMLKQGTALQTGNIVDDADNRCYRVSGSGTTASLVSIDTDYVMYYPVDGSEVDFVAYYPHTFSLSFEDGRGEAKGSYIYPVRIDDQTDFAAIDLLHGTGTGSKRNKTVAIAMAHQLSKIRVVVSKAAELSGLDFTGTQVTLTGMPLASGFDLGTTTFDYLNEAGVKEIGRLLAQTITEGTIYEAIVLPQPAGQFSGRQVAFALGEGNGDYLPYAYNWYIPDGTTFRPGKEYTYTFTLRASSVEFGNLTITDWDDYSFEATAVEMVSITGGTFLMGSPDGIERNPDETLHEVTLSDFMISRFPITNSQYAVFLNTIQLPANGIQEGESLLAATNSQLSCTTILVDGMTTYRWYPLSGKEEHPVTGVSWHGAHAFAMWQGGSLPTEAQWEYACRGSETLHPGLSSGEWDNSSYCFGNEVSRLSRYAWYEANNNTINENTIGTKEVGTRLMNAFTLYDMHGNVWEWCADWYAAYDTPATPNPMQSNSSSGKRVLRGGAFDSPAEDCRSARRHNAVPEGTGENIGFRVVF